jgi:bifunctional non-homologous end joining protein LigD
MGLSAARDVDRGMAMVPVVATFFDCLSLNGHDLRGLPLTQRKECLRLFIPPLGTVRYSDHVLDQGAAFFNAAFEQRLEGIVGKKVRSRYVGGRSPDWIKVKCQRRQEFVIGGYTDPQGTRGYFGALHIGLYDGPRLAYVSKVGTGFDEKALKEIWDMLQPLRRQTSPFDVNSPAGRGHHWVEPKLVCEVRYTEWTRDGGIRHPTFLGMRPDKKPADVRRETPAAPALAALETPVPARSLRASSRSARGEPRVALTNLGKVFWPDEGYTKGDMIAYYDAVAPLLLPYLKERPLVLTRYPDGITGKSFFQKDAPEFAPGWVRTERIYSRDVDREINYFIADDAETLRYVANSASIPLHIWASRLQALDRPDWLVLDLDPKGAPFAHVVRVARTLHDVLRDLRLPNYVKTSGSTGLHVLVPLGARYSYEDARTFARLLAHLGQQVEPEIATLARPVGERGGKVYIDYVQNGQGRTIVAPFSLRPLPGAPASCPLRWDEVGPGLDPAQFTLKNLPARFSRMRDPMAPVLTGTIDMAAAIARIERRLAATKPRRGPRPSGR